MIVVMDPGASAAQIDAVRRHPRRRSSFAASRTVRSHGSIAMRGVG